jgi:hypothetical protein
LWNLESRYVEFVRLPAFERTAKGVLTEEEIRLIEERLTANPGAGDIIANTGGVRKLRAVNQGRGKRGSARVIYLYVRVRETIYLLLAYPKNARANLSDEQKRGIRTLVARLREEV